MKNSAELSKPTRPPSKTPIDVAQRPFQSNINGMVARLQLGGGRILFCDAVVLTERDLVVVIPGSEGLPDRGETVRCSLFLTDDDTYVAHRSGVIHWEMAIHGERMAAIFLNTVAPAELLELAANDQRGGVRFPANLGCTVESKADSTDGRLVNYSLDGLATQLPEAMTIGETYTILIDAGDDTIEIEGLCRWNFKSAYGFINGCSCDDEDGYKLARREFRGSVMPWDINRTRAARSTSLGEDIDDALEVESTDKSVRRRPFISSTTILILSATLIGLSTLGPAEGKTIAFLAGCLGIVTFIGLQWTAQTRTLLTAQRASARIRETVENRLRAHLAVKDSE